MKTLQWLLHYIINQTEIVHRLMTENEIINDIRFNWSEILEEYFAPSSCGSSAALITVHVNEVLNWFANPRCFT